MRSVKASRGVECLVVLMVMVAWIPLQGQLSSPSRPKERSLLYVAAQGTAYVPPHHYGLGVLVFDVSNQFRFVKRIPTFEVPASRVPELAVGMAASPAAGLLYISFPSRLLAIDLTTDKKAWEHTYDGQCCEMIATSPDGKMLYLNSNYKSHMYAVDAKTGALIRKVEYPATFDAQTRVERAHNINWSPDGSRVFMSGSGPKDVFISVADPKTHTMLKAIGPFGESVRQFTTNGRGTLLFVNTVGLCGFEVADVNAGKVVHRVECPGDWKEKLKADPTMRLGHGTPSHGIAMTADEKEIWVVDGVNASLHVFDATTMPPRPTVSIKTRVPPYTVGLSLDDTYVLSMSGDVIDAKTKKVVAGLKDEYGRDVYSEKMIQATFGPDGKMLRANERFSKGRAFVPTN
jgi:DNA-binding beta-propeller fold protein YncE